ncbi:sugar-binding transcriptional regulator [Shouchella shacheensis]|uniref:sugar-binding transcriptional regulator n=1 Tax=Shouchella shacheensis TaxID=1649580 RepID=UPI000740027E|nr:sugar-binding transcriptional regulator [Shouchella shacheensis]
MNWHEERSLIIVSKMYYEESLTQNEIAKRLGIYRTTVTRMLQKARDIGVVRIEIVETQRVRVELEKQLAERYGLAEVFVVPVEPETSRRDRLELIGKAAVSLVDSILVDGDVVGLAWGSTVGTMADVIEKGRKRDIRFVPIVGGPGKMRVDHHVNTIAYSFAKAFKSKAYYIDSAAIVQSKETRDEIMDSDYMQDVRHLWKEMTVSIIGIGAPIRSSNLVWTGFLGDGEAKKLESENIVGDICSRFYTIDGVETNADLRERAVAIELERLRENRATIAVAESREKVASIVGALRGDYLTHLVTDEETAEAILNWEE